MVLDFGNRKIQFIRGSAFVSLPRLWIRTNSIDKGDSVRLSLSEDGTLIVFPIERAKSGVKALGLAKLGGEPVDNS